MRTLSRFQTPLLGVFLLSTVAHSVSAQADAPIVGRWNLTVQGANGPYPAWLEVTLSGNRVLVGRFMSGGGSARPISRVEYVSGAMRFTIPPQWDAVDNELSVDGRLENGVLKGTVTTPNRERHPFVALRAPALRRSAPVQWGPSRPLFNGKDLTGWTARGGTNRWEAREGVLTNTRGGANLVTTETFTDFKLHVEVKYPKGGNSGIYLRGRYEVQVEDVAADVEPLSVHLGGIYGLLVPNENVAKGPDVWQTFDITLIGRRVTVVLNGKTIIADQTIPGITGGALDSDEASPGPIYLQGDHGPVAYRNLVITPATSGAK